MDRTPLFNALVEYNRLSRGYFRIPGHRFERGVPEAFRAFAGDGIFRLDVTETPLSDDLHNPKDVIAESQRQTAEAFGADSSYYLVNGTTCGNQAMVAAAAREGEKILIPRNAHKSVLAGLILSGAEPVYLPVEYLPASGLSGVVRQEAVEEALDREPDIKAVFTVSPTYHGLCSDLAGIAAASHHRGVPLLVDEAHGAHFYFSDSLPPGALTAGADCCAQSLHKTAGALTQSSLLHLKSSLLDPGRIDAALRMTMSTSPSYLLLASLELAREELERKGAKSAERSLEIAEELRGQVNTLSLFSSPGAGDFRTAGIPDYDAGRLIVDCGASGLTGYQLKQRLWEEFHIDAELPDHRNLLFLVTPGNTREEGRNLIEALRKIESSCTPAGTAGTAEMPLPGVPRKALSPRQAWLTPVREVPWDEMKGCVASEPAVPYPPGIPVLYPGEIISQEIYAFLDQQKKRGRHLHGFSDPSLKTVRVCTF